MKVVALGIAVNGPIDLGLDLGNETKVSIDVAANMKRTPNMTWF